MIIKSRVKIKAIPYFLLFKILSKLSFMFPDRLALKVLYRNAMGRKLDLKNPKSFNEKIQWLKLYDRKNIYTTMVDKYSAKDYISKIIGNEYVIPTLGVYKDFDEIDFGSLPNQFVLKTTHDSGTVIICENKSTFNYHRAKQRLEKALKTNYYKLGREWPYKNVNPQIIAEKYLKNKYGKPIIDYKMMCFNGKVRCSFVCLNRGSKTGLNVDFYDNNWVKMPFERHYSNSSISTPCPNNYDRMVEISEKISYGLSFVRVDFYEVSDKIYVGEITLYPGNGLERFTPDEWDYELGTWLELPKLKGN